MFALFSLCRRPPGQDLFSSPSRPRPRSTPLCPPLTSGIACTRGRTTLFVLTSYGRHMPKISVTELISETQNVELRHITIDLLANSTQRDQKANCNVLSDQILRPKLQGHRHHSKDNFLQLRTASSLLLFQHRTRQYDPFHKGLVTLTLTGHFSYPSYSQPG